MPKQNYYYVLCYISDILHVLTHLVQLFCKVANLGDEKTDKQLG